ncbi:MAG TPA: hypothetical protein VFS16_00610, partial [Acidimicrobiia bacterium]|nr:hypothetical protein [Acidimicrobiia bacterium]
AGGDGRSGEPTISGDGTKVAFTSDAGNLGTGGGPGADIFISTLGASSTVMMLTSGANAYLPSISADGTKVVFIAEGYDNDGLADVYQSSAQGGAKPTIYAQCPCRSGGDVPPNWATIGSGGAMLYSSAAPFSRSNRYLDAQVFSGNPGQAIVSVRDEDVVANGPAEFPSTNADGKLVAFQSTADNLVDGDTNDASDVFLAQMGDSGNGYASHRMIRISVGDPRRGADSFAPAPRSRPALSADGNLVVFASDSTNLVPGDTNGVSDIFVRNRSTGKTERVSVAGGGGQADGASVTPAMSADGRFVVFASSATNLAPGDTNGVLDIYVRDRLRKETRRLSEKPGAGQSPLPAQHPAISPNGRFVAFDSAGEFAAIGQSGSGRPNVFRLTMETGAIEMVSTRAPDSNNTARTAGFKASWSPTVADDGSVAFLSDQTGMTASNADDPVGGIPNWTDVYVGRPDGTVVKASMNSDPQPVKAEGDSYDAQISGDGTKVVFAVGGRSNMPKTSADQNPGADVYLRDLSGNSTIQLNVGGDGAGTGGTNRWPTVNQDGSVVAFVSDAGNLAGGDANGLADVFLAKVAGGSVSVSRIGDPNGPGTMPALTLDGHTVAFASRATNLVGGDGNGAYDWFARSDADVPCVTCTPDGVADGPIGSLPPVGGKASGPGYRFVASDGGIFSFDQSFHGSAGNTKLAKPIVGMAATPSNNGYWLVASDGGIFSYGDAAFWGSTGNIKLATPIVGMAATPSGKGYWFVASDGGIFNYGSAEFCGSTGRLRLNSPIVGIS